MTRRLMLSLGAVLAIGACSDSSTTPSTGTESDPDFITYGVTDDGEHPYVGFMLFFDPTTTTGSGWFSCSGTLLDATTFLTAGHCTFDIGTNGSVTPTHSGGNDVWVTLEEKVNLEDFPRAADFPDRTSLYIARRDWLNDNPVFTRGTSHPHPEFANFAEFPANHDVGIVELIGDPNHEVNVFGFLAPLGRLDALAGTGKDHNKVLIETAGYGIQEIRPDFISLDERWKSTSTIVNLRSALTDGWNVHTSNNPSPANGRGGSCFGDSGGALFLNNTREIVAVVSFGLNSICKGADFAARTDIADSRDFILPFLD